MSRVNKVVIDEADELLKLGFIEDVELLIEAAAGDRQLILCSATIPERIRALSVRFMNKPQTILVEPKIVTLDNIKQSVVRVKEGAKLQRLCEVLEAERPYLAMVFCAKKAQVDWLVIELAQRGFKVDGLHGDLTQQQRNFVLRQFREAKLQVLVATDIAARGLDIEGVSHVISFDIPRSTVDYIHRIGRTGRAGQSGTAITFVTDSEIDKLRTIEAGIKKQLGTQNNGPNSNVKRQNGAKKQVGNKKQKKDKSNLCRNNKEIKQGQRLRNKGRN